MTPAEIVTNVKSLALMGAMGTSADDVKVYRFVNISISRVYEKVAAKYPWAVQEFQDVAIVNGEGTMADEPLHILGVRDANNGYEPLDATDVGSAQEDDPGLDATGTPEEYWQVGKDGLRTHPRNDTTAQVSFTPLPETVTSSSTEDDLFLPSVFHEVYVWETLKLMAYDERDKIVGAELAFNEKEYNDCYDRIWRHYDAKAPQKQKQVTRYIA